MATYYISNAGSDGANGTSTGTSWQTISKVNGSSFSPGDSILLKRGDVWREQLTLPSSGTVGNLITFGAYGTGALPIINGANVVTGWTNSATNIWWVNNPNPVTTRAMVIIGGLIYNEVGSAGALIANSYFIDTAPTPDRIYIFYGGNPNNITTEVSARDYCIGTFSGTSKKYIEVDDIEVRYAGRGGIYFEAAGSPFDGSSIVRRCVAYANRIFGIAHYDHYDNLLVEDCTSTFNGNGYYSWISDGGTFRRNSSGNSIVYLVGANVTDGHAFGGYQANNFLVEENITTLDNDSIHSDPGGIVANAIIRYNRIYYPKFGSGAPNTPGIGVGNLAATGLIQIYYNLIVNPASNGFESYTVNSGTINFFNNTIYQANGYGVDFGGVYLVFPSNFVLKNNIIMREGNDGKSMMYLQNAGSATSDYNQFFQSAGAYRWHNSAGNYATIALWRTATSQDSNSQIGDPLFVNVASDWSLQSGSPCINKGVNVGLTRDIQGNSVSGTPDMGCYEYGGSIQIQGPSSIIFVQI